MLTAEQLAAAVAEAPIDRLPDLIGLLAAAQARAMARMVAPVATVAPIGPELVPTAEMAGRAGVSVFWLREQANAARIPVHHAGRRMLFDPVTTVAAIKALERTPRRRKNGCQDKRSWGLRRQKSRDSQHLPAPPIGDSADLSKPLPIGRPGDVQ